MMNSRHYAGIALVCGFSLLAGPVFAQKKTRKAAPVSCECKGGKAGKKMGKRDACAVPLTLSLSGLHCQGCEILVTQHLMGVKGVEEANVNAKDQRAVVWVCPHQSVPQSALKTAVEKAGYKVVRIDKGNVKTAAPTAEKAEVVTDGKEEN